MPTSTSITTSPVPQRVCVVDGDPAVRDSLATLMALDEREVRTYERGAELLRDLSVEPAECVVCASELPDMSGVELFLRLRASHPEVRFALLLSRNDHFAMLNARRSGIDAVFQKPLVHRKLRQFVGGL